VVGWDEYTPFEKWRGERGSEVDGALDLLGEDGRRVSPSVDIDAFRALGCRSGCDCGQLLPTTSIICGARWLSERTLWRNAGN
jgi:hypothetical protein